MRRWMTGRLYLLLDCLFLLSVGASETQHCPRLKIDRHSLSAQASSTQALYSFPLLIKQPPESRIPFSSPVLPLSSPSLTPLSLSSSPSSVTPPPPSSSISASSKRRPKPSASSPTSPHISYPKNNPSSSLASVLQRTELSQHPSPLSSLGKSWKSSTTPSPGEGTAFSQWCWTSGGEGSLALTTDHRGNLWALHSSVVGPEASPGAVWVLNFTSLTWKDFGHHTREKLMDERLSMGSLAEGRGTVAPSPPPTPVAKASQDTRQLTVSSTPSSAQPVAFCSWAHGLVSLYVLNGTSSTWLLPFKSARWRRLLKPQADMASPEMSSVSASWCGRLSDHLWVLTATQVVAENERNTATKVLLDHNENVKQTLWKLDPQGKWSALDVTSNRNDRNSHFSSFKNIHTWSDSRGDLFVLQEGDAPSSASRVVRYDTASGSRTFITIKQNESHSIWVPGGTGELYSIFSDIQGTWIKAINYYTGAVISTDAAGVSMGSESLLVEIKGTIFNRIPFCKSRLPFIVKNQVPAAATTAKEIGLYRISVASDCLPPPLQNNKHRQKSIMDIFADSGDITMKSIGKTSVQSDLPITQAAFVGEEVESKGAAEVVVMPPLKAAKDLSQASDNLHEGITIITDSEEAEGETGVPTVPRHRDRGHSKDSVIFFSLSLSIFALVGIVIFFRKCVRCPPAHELGEGGDRRGSKPPSPLPVLYSIVPDEAPYETSGTESPCCPSQNALYDATISSETTPNGGTPNFMTPGVLTPYATTPTAHTPYNMTPNNTPTVLTPSTIARHQALSPNTQIIDGITYAIANTTQDAINIATNKAFNSYGTNTTQF